MKPASIRRTKLHRKKDELKGDAETNKGGLKGGATSPVIKVGEKKNRTMPKG